MVCRARELQRVQGAARARVHGPACGASGGGKAIALRSPCPPLPWQHIQLQWITRPPSSSGGARTRACSDAAATGAHNLVDNSILERLLGVKVLVARKVVGHLFRQGRSSGEGGAAGSTRGASQRAPAPRPRPPPPHTHSTHTLNTPCQRAGPWPLTECHPCSRGCASARAPAGGGGGGGGGVGEQRRRVPRNESAACWEPQTERAGNKSPPPPHTHTRHSRTSRFMSEACPRAAPEGWWIMMRVFWSAYRLPCGAQEARGRGWGWRRAAGAWVGGWQ